MKKTTLFGIAFFIIFNVSAQADDIEDFIKKYNGKAFVSLDIIKEELGLDDKDKNKDKNKDKDKDKDKEEDPSTED